MCPFPPAHIPSLSLCQAQEDVRQQLREFEETKKQIEEDEDREIQDIKTKYEKKLRDEKESNLRLKGETGIMRKKVRVGPFPERLGQARAALQRKRGAGGQAADLAESCPKVLVSSKQVRKGALTGVRVLSAPSGRQSLTASYEGVTVGASLLFPGIVRLAVTVTDTL